MLSQSNYKLCHREFKQLFQSNYKLCHREFKQLFQSNYKLCHREFKQLFQSNYKLCHRDFKQLFQSNYKLCHREFKQLFQSNYKFCHGELKTLPWVSYFSPTINSVTELELKQLPEWVSPLITDHENSFDRPYITGLNFGVKLVSFQSWDVSGLTNKASLNIID